jgi:SPP1 gp7 family putative phage head morphogenesis protein
MKAVTQAQTEIMNHIEAKAGNLSEWSEERSLALLDELSDLSLGIRYKMAGDISEISAQAGAHSYLIHNDVLSFGQKVLGFNNVALTATQIQQLVSTVPVGGKLLSEWVDSTFEYQLKTQIQQEITTGMLRGQGYPGLARRLGEGFDLTRQDAISLTRTYVASVNVGAQEAVMRANKDVIKGWKWCAALEPGFSKTGRGTCIRCAALDGQVFQDTDPARPEIPLHVRCRCMWLAETVSWKSLGLDIPEIESAYRPYTIRPDKNIGVGGTRTIEEVGFHHGDYSTWYETRDKSFQINAVGPGRYELLNSGKVEFKDLVGPKGKLRTLKELEAL